jgi:nitroreductase
MSREEKSALEMLANRRSVKAQELCEPGPDDATLRAMLEAAMRVPDHGKLGPWRFLVLRGNSRGQLGVTLATRFRELNPDADDEAIALERGRFERAPVVVTVVSSPNRKAVKIPLWEQQLSAGAACQNLLNAALFAGYGAQWLTEWTAYDDDVAGALGLSEHERVAGFVYIGSIDAPPEERSRPAYESRVSEWSPSNPEETR